MKSLRWLILVLALPLFCGHAMAGEPLRIATEGAYPPFNYIDDQGNLSGFDVEIAKALCQAMNAECTLEAVKWDDILPGLTQNKYDAVIASMAQTPERQKFADFTDYYYRSRSTFVGSPTKPFVQTSEGLSGLTLTAQRDTVQARYLQDNFSDTATIRNAPTTDEAFAMLVRGETDAVLSDSLTIFGFLQTPEGAAFDFVGSPLPESDPSSTARIAVRKGDTQLLNAFHKALRDIRLNGTYDKINRRYFPFSIY